MKLQKKFQLFRIQGKLFLTKECETLKQESFKNQKKYLHKKLKNTRQCKQSTFQEWKTEHGKTEMWTQAQELTTLKAL